MFARARLWRSKVIDSRAERRKRRMELKLAFSAFAIFIPAFTYSCIMYNASKTIDYDWLVNYYLVFSFLEKSVKCYF